MNDFMADQLEDRVQQLENHQNECIEDGDNIYSQMREEMRNQEETENDIHNKTNVLAHQTNIVLRSKLNSNKGDFERLRRTGQKDGLIGVDLERQVVSYDKKIADIIQVKKDAHKHLVNSRDVMKCDIGRDQKPYNADMS